MIRQITSFEELLLLVTCSKGVGTCSGVGKSLNRGKFVRLLARAWKVVPQWRSSHAVRQERTAHSNRRLKRKPLAHEPAITSAITEARADSR
jgi:hypothetical protein